MKIITFGIDGFVVGTHLKVKKGRFYFFEEFYSNSTGETFRVLKEKGNGVRS